MNSDVLDQPEDAEAAPRPVHEIRMGLVKAAIWQNASADGERVWYKATFSKLYRDHQAEEWRSVKNFDMLDCLLLAEVARQASVWMFSR